MSAKIGHFGNSILPVAGKCCFDATITRLPENLFLVALVYTKHVRVANASSRGLPYAFNGSMIISAAQLARPKP